MIFPLQESVWTAAHRTLHKLAEHQAPLPGSPRRGDSVSSMQQQKGRRSAFGQPLASQFPTQMAEPDFARTRPGSPRSTLDQNPGQSVHMRRLSVSPCLALWPLA